MVYRSVQQLQRVVAQLDQAIYNHEQWYKMLVRTLIARLPSEDSDIRPDAHRRCRFGQWYESEETRSLRDHPTFVALGQAHEQMHRSATHLLRRVADDLPVMPADVDQFNNVLDRMKLEILSLRRELSDAVQNRDPLTGARNRAGLLADLREQQALVRRGAGHCAIALIDIDHFKDVNDRYGHVAGDTVLASTSECIEGAVRLYDRIYRYGGEEFLLCMPNTSIETALGLAERLRGVIAVQRFMTPNEGLPVQVTASFGVASLDADLPVEESIDRADKALYRAKGYGRNRVEGV